MSTTLKKLRKTGNLLNNACAQVNQWSVVPELFLLYNSYETLAYKIILNQEEDIDGWLERQKAPAAWRRAAGL